MDGLTFLFREIPEDSKERMRSRAIIWLHLLNTHQRYILCDC
jgi:hypothetical protein